MYQPAISVLQLHLQLLSEYLLQSKMTTLHITEERRDTLHLLVSTAHSDIR